MSWLMGIVAGSCTSEKGFYIGDPCYVLPDDLYTGVWAGTKFIPGTVYFGKATSVRPCSMAVGRTAFGDGLYTDGEGHSYGVDSGTLACIPLEFCTADDPSFHGRVVEGVQCTMVDDTGRFEFTVMAGNGRRTVVRIATDGSDDEDDGEDWI